MSSNSRDIIKFVGNAINLSSNTLCALFLLSFKIFNYNFHNGLVNFGASTNVMPLSIAKKINAKWEKIDAQII